MYIYPIGTTDACQRAARLLHCHGVPLVDHPTPEVTHLLLDVPAFQSSGLLRGGGEIVPLLRMLPPNIRILGGNLDVPALKGYPKTDLLKDERFLAKNAAITADCALRLSGEKMSFTFYDAPALVIGWGRIGKCLCSMLHALGCRVTLAARKESDRAMAEALGYHSIPIDQIPSILLSCRLLFNTVPHPILSEAIPAGCIALELASKDGIPREGSIPARGLPGILAPETSGKLIAETVLQKLKEERL